MNKDSASILLSSLENAYRQIVNSRDRLLERRMYAEYLVLAEFCQVLNAILVELAKFVGSRP
jgi:hypothetical protein